MTIIKPQNPENMKKYLYSYKPQIPKKIKKY